MQSAVDSTGQNKETLQGLDLLDVLLHRRPLSDLGCWQVRPHVCPAVATCITAQHACENVDEGAGMMKSAEEWARQHVALRASTEPAAAEARPRARKKKMCVGMAMCCCRGEGLQATRLQAKLHDAIKSRFVGPSSELMQGNAALLLQGRVAGENSEAEPVNDLVILYVAHACLKPFQLTVLQLHPADAVSQEWVEAGGPGVAG